MTRVPEESPKDQDMKRAIEMYRARRKLWESNGERPLWKNLSMIGVLGWLIVTPILFGILVGRWLDIRFGTGIFWSGALIMTGAAFGGYLAWQRISKNDNT